MGMIKSMTGYGNSRVAIDNITISVELKTLNSKFLDLSIKSPKELSSKEIDIRTILTKSLERGKANLIIEVNDQSADSIGLNINKEYFKNSYQKLLGLSKELGSDSADIFRLVFGLPESTSKNDDDIYEKLWPSVKTCIEEAVKKCDDFRINEGEVLFKSFQEYITNIGTSLKQVIALDPTRIETIRARIKKNISEFIEEEKIDKNRFEQEIIYYTEKLDITEEKVRLKKHIDHFSKVLNEAPPQGKKLGFIVQEIGREINTIGSKANHAEIQICVIKMKEELEKIKEQVLNIL